LTFSYDIMASTTTMTVAIAGITGKMGQLIAKHLLARSNVKVRGLCRTPSKLPASLTSNPRLSVFKSDANDTKGIHSALKGSDVAVCCYLGDVDVMIEGQKRLIDACISEKVPRYVASDWSVWTSVNSLTQTGRPPSQGSYETRASLSGGERS
jgi:uncharacterized protein YbjT (DUF2867 family)